MTTCIRSASSTIPSLGRGSDDAAKHKLEKLRKTVLDARVAHEDATLADLYDPVSCRRICARRIARSTRRSIGSIRKEPFASDRERVEHLFGLYEKLTAPMLAAAAKPKPAGKVKAGPSN